MGILSSIFGPGERRSRLTPGVSLRDPGLIDIFGGGAQTATGVAITPDTARECPEVDACVGLIEDTIATVPLDLFERTGEATRERLADLG